MSGGGASEEFRCFVGGLSWSTDDEALENNFREFGRILEAKVIIDRASGRSRGFGFVTFADQRGLEDAIDRVHNKELDGRVVTVSKAMPPDHRDREREDHHHHRQGQGQGQGQDHHREEQQQRYQRDRERDKMDYGGYSNGFASSRQGGDNSNDSCFRCGRSGHWARDCPMMSSSHRGGYGREREQFGGSYRYAAPPPPLPPGADYYDRYDRYGTSDDGYGGRDRSRYEYHHHHHHRERGASGGPMRYDHSYSRDSRPGPYDHRLPPFDRSPAAAAAALGGYDRPRMRGGGGRAAASYDHRY